MRFFLDTEFIESGPWQPIHLLSLAIVPDEGGEFFYAINADCPLADANDWVKQNVLPHLGDGHRIPLKDMGHQVKGWLRIWGGKPEFWGYYADYDWVVFCQIFGTMMDLPEGWPMYCRDLKQWCDDLGNPRLPTQETTEHNALNDARWNRDVWRFLNKRQALSGTPPLVLP